MTFKEFVQSSTFTRIIYVIGGLLIALVVFQAGIFVGYRVAAFSINWDNAHSGNLKDPRSIFAPFARDADDMNPHGAIGEIISVKLPKIMVKGPSDDEEIILVSGMTSIRNMRSAATSSDLKVGQQVVVIGTPDDQGEIQATLIRVIPLPSPDTKATAEPVTPTSTSPTINQN